MTGEERYPYYYYLTPKHYEALKKQGAVPPNVLIVQTVPTKKKAAKKKPNVNIKGWHWIRQAILDRDEYACRICGVVDGLEVHHVDSNRQNNERTNLVTLCSNCHRAVHAERYVPWEHEDYPAPWGILE